MRVRLTIWTGLFMLLLSQSVAQTLTKLKSVTLNQEVVHVSIDRQRNLYVAGNNGDIDRFDREGNLSYHFSPDTKGNVSVIEAWQGLRTFVFYRDFQQYLFLDRFLSSPNRLNIGTDLSRYYQLATIAADNNLWVIDLQELSLKKLDIELNEFLLETPLNLNLDPENFELAYLREYQNMLYIADKNSGVLVFDNLGNYIETLPLKGVEYFSFNNNELLALNRDGQLKLIDVYSKKEREIGLPNLSYRFVLMENSRLYCFQNRRLDIFRLD